MDEQQDRLRIPQVRGFFVLSQVLQAPPQRFHLSLEERRRVLRLSQKHPNAKDDVDACKSLVTLRKNMKIYIKLNSQLSVRRFIAFFMG